MSTAATVPLLAAARQGDQQAFRQLTEPHRAGLHLHCYRMRGSFHEAEDLVQETLLRAWRRLATFTGTGPFRSWLFRVATNACLDALERKPRRLLPDGYGPSADAEEPVLQPPAEDIWLEPYPDRFLASADADPDARYLVHESISLAFVAAIQWLPARQRAALILHDVLSWSAAEIGTTLSVTPFAVYSLLQRARSTLRKRRPLGEGRAASPIQPLDQSQRVLLDRYVRTWEAADIAGLVALLRDEAVLTMPPVPSWYSGRAAIARFLAKAFHQMGKGPFRLARTGANGQPAFGLYEWDPHSGDYRPSTLQVLRIEDALIAEITGFVDPRLFSLFGLPSRLEAPA
jgi:RNA polymerase sigma-70 factor (ECF subfamily)